MSVLTTSQQAALEAEGEVLVAAAAGSGKTRVLTGRIVRAITEQGIPLEGVVAVTFTEKAAHEIRSRVARACAEIGRTDLVAGLETAMIGTIHALCARLLRRYGAATGIDPGFAILDSTHAAWLRNRAVEDALEEASIGDADALSVRARYGDERLTSLVLAAIDAASQRPDRALSWPDGRDAAIISRIVEAAGRRYETSCRRAGGLDFEALQHGALAVLAVDDVRLDIQSRVQRVLVDEFQDTNLLQCAVIDAIGGGCTFAVGDEWQSIYRFRAADVAVFRQRAARVEAIPMRDNFRSAAPVLDVVNGIFGRVFGDRYDHVQVGRGRGDGSSRCRMLLAAPGPGDGRALEAALVADDVARLVRDGTDPATIAILVARQTHARAFELALEQRGIAVLRSASRGYYDQRDVSDVTALLALVRNRRDERAALTVLAGPLVRLSPRELLELRQMVAAVAEGSLPGTIWDAVVASAAAGDERCSKVVRIVGQLQQLLDGASLADVVEHAVNSSGIAELVLSRPDGRRGYANLRKLIELAAAAESAGIRDIGRYLDLVGSQSIRIAEGDAALADESSGSVRIMTVHASKGLEFDHVYVADTANAGPRDRPSLLVSREGTVAFEMVDEHGDSGVVTDALEQLRAVHAAEARAEEQRLMYVALTRAKEQLVISGTLVTRSGGVLAATGPLSWLLEAIDCVPEPGSATHAELPLQVDVCTTAGDPVMLELHTQPTAIATPPEVLMPSVAGPAFESEQPPRSAQGPSPVDEEATVDGVILHRWLASAIDGAVHQQSQDHGLTELAADELPPHLVGPARNVVGSPLVRELVACRARVEVPWTLALADGSTVTGRFDCLALLPDGVWWIHDHKLTLPRDASAAWNIHGDQLERYAMAARAGGASSIRLTLQSAREPEVVHEYTV